MQCPVWPHRVPGDRRDRGLPPHLLRPPGQLLPGALGGRGHRPIAAGPARGGPPHRPGRPVGLHRSRGCAPALVGAPELRTRAADSNQTGATRAALKFPLRRLAGFAVSFRSTGKRQAMCVSSRPAGSRVRSANSRRLGRGCKRGIAGCPAPAIETAPLGTGGVIRGPRAADPFCWPSRRRRRPRLGVGGRLLAGRVCVQEHCGREGRVTCQLTRSGPRHRQDEESLIAPELCKHRRGSARVVAGRPSVRVCGEDSLRQRFPLLTAICVGDADKHSRPPANRATFGAAQ
jgi:hypothetical protein